MRTTLDLPAGLIQDAQQVLGFKSKTDTVVYALAEVVRRHKLKELAGMVGHLGLDIDLDKVRRRPKK
jgi:Arc/MetJ family transcription regulator